MAVHRRQPNQLMASSSRMATLMVAGVIHSHHLMVVRVAQVQLLQVELLKLLLRVDMSNGKFCS